MSNKNDNDDIKATGDVLEAIIVYEKDSRESNKYAKNNIPSNEIYVGERGSANDQADELMKSILEGKGKDSTIKALSRILQSGDPITESRTTMIVLARRELTKLLKTMDSLDRIEDIILDRIEQGVYDNSPTYELSSLLQRLEQSMSRSITIVSKVLGDKDYEEFLLAYRDSIGDDDAKSKGQLGKIGMDKDSRAKVRQAAQMIRDSLTAKSNEDCQD